jgi:hypothetical protein
MQNSSDIVQIRQQIEAECQSLSLIFHGYAVVSSHEAISHKYQSIEHHHNQLAQHIGEEEATNTVVDIYNKAIH